MLVGSDQQIKGNEGFLDARLPIYAIKGDILTAIKYIDMHHPDYVVLNKIQPVNEIVKGKKYLCLDRVVHSGGDREFIPGIVYASLQDQQLDRNFYIYSIGGNDYRPNFVEWNKDSKKYLQAFIDKHAAYKKQDIPSILGNSLSSAMKEYIAEPVKKSQPKIHYATGINPILIKEQEVEEIEVLGFLNGSGEICRTITFKSPSLNLKHLKLDRQSYGDNGISIAKCSNGLLYVCHWNDGLLEGFETTDFGQPVVAPKKYLKPIKTNYIVTASGLLKPLSTPCFFENIELSAVKYANDQDLIYAWDGDRNSPTSSALYLGHWNGGVV